jgi:hypothetical protein
MFSFRLVPPGCVTWCSNGEIGVPKVPKTPVTEFKEFSFATGARARDA